METISLETLIANAKENITSRDAYIQQAIEQLMNAPLRLFINRSRKREVNDLVTMKIILKYLNLSDAYLEQPFKDLIYLILAYAGSEDEDKRISAGNAIMHLAKLVSGNNWYIYKR